MDDKEFLTALQIVDLTRQQPELKPVHDYMLKKCVDHAKEIADQIAKAKEAEDTKAKAEVAEPVKSSPAQTSGQRYSRS
jgi:hypothetical protein